MLVHSRLKTWRKKRGLNQLAAARAALVPQGAWSMIENGLRRPTLEQAFLIEKLTAGEIRAAEWSPSAKLRRIRSVS
jgi:transcriptional regulator with XRE-family HTH domain